MRSMRKHLISFFFLFILTLLPRSASADLVIVGKAIAVMSGDTLKVLWTGGIEMVRLADIDTPKAGEPQGQEAKWFTEDHTIALTVIVTIKGVDQFGRSVGEVFLEDGRSLNQELVKNGLARWRKKYLDGAIFERLEREAKEKKVGLWGE